MCECVCESVCVRERQDSGRRLEPRSSLPAPQSHPHITAFLCLGFGGGNPHSSSPLSTHFLGDHTYLLITLTTCILPESMLHSDQNSCNRLFARVSHARPCLTLNHDLPSIFMPVGYTPSACNVGISFPLFSFSIC